MRLPTSPPFSLTLPALGNDTPDRYAAALYIGDSVAGRSAAAARADSLQVKLRAVGGAHKTLDVMLIEKDGTAWSTAVAAGGAWSTARTRSAQPVAQQRREILAAARDTLARTRDT